MCHAKLFTYCSADEFGRKLIQQAEVWQENFAKQRALLKLQLTCKAYQEKDDSNHLYK